MTAGLEKIVGKDYIENMAPLKRSGSAEDAAGEWRVCIEECVCDVSH